MLWCRNEKDERLETAYHEMFVYFAYQFNSSHAEFKVALRASLVIVMILRVFSVMIVIGDCSDCLNLEFLRPLAFNMTSFRI